MHRFFIERESIQDGVARLNAKESRHALSVLRLKSGDAVQLFDGKGETFSGVVIGPEKESLLVSVSRHSAVSRQAPVRITLGVSVIKPDRMELLIQKACELGADAIAPFLSERSVVRLSPERWQHKMKRWKKIALESCKQCGRGAPPAIENVESYESVLRHSTDDLIVIPTLAAPPQPLYEALRQSQPKSLLVLIGPEGDFTKKEVEMALVKGAKTASLGPLILRSETAAWYLLSALGFYYREISKS